MHAPVPDRVRANTWFPVNDRLDMEAQLRMREAAALASTDELTRRVTQLDYEWDFDRTVGSEASLMGLLGLTLGIAVDKRFLVLPAFVSTMLLVHATHGWYPLLPLFRRIGHVIRRNDDESVSGSDNLFAVVDSQPQRVTLHDSRSSKRLVQPH